MPAAEQRTPEKKRTAAQSSACGPRKDQSFPRSTVHAHHRPRHQSISMKKGMELQRPRFEDPERVDPWHAGSREDLLREDLSDIPRSHLRDQQDQGAEAGLPSRRLGIEDWAWRYVPRQPKPVGSWMCLYVPVPTYS